jgi:hypothetical protein
MVGTLGPTRVDHRFDGRIWATLIRLFCDATLSEVRLIEVVRQIPFFASKYSQNRMAKSGISHCCSDIFATGAHY